MFCAPAVLQDNALDTRCQALLIGKNRLQRGLNYANYLATRGFRGGRGPMFGIFHGGHDNKAFYASPLFGDWVLSHETDAGV